LRRAWLLQKKYINPTEASSGPAWLVPVISGAATLLVEGIKLLVKYLQEGDVDGELVTSVADLDEKIKDLETAFDEIKKTVLTPPTP
jgi:hypothetical protein